MTPLVRRAAEFGAAFTGIEPHEVWAPTKRHEVTQARHAAWGYRRSLRRKNGQPRVSLKAIAYYTGIASGKGLPYDHTSVMYGIARFKEREPDQWARMHLGLDA